MSDEEIERIAKMLGEIHDVLPAWMMNPPEDYDSGDDFPPHRHPRS